MASTTISFPSYARLDVESINMSEANKMTALTVGNLLSVEHLEISNGLTSQGTLSCDKDLFVKGKIKAVTTGSLSVFFRGRLNLTNHTVNYNLGSSSSTVSFNNIHSYQDQQYIPYGLFKQFQAKSCMRSAESGGATGSGDLQGSMTQLYWDSYGETYKEENSSVVSINPNDKAHLAFTASPTQPKLLRISFFFMKHGGWIDNGTGGDLAIGVIVNGQKTYLSTTTSAGTSYFRSKAMQCIAATYYAETNGHFFAENQGSTIRVAYFSWNVVQLPFYHRKS